MAHAAREALGKIAEVLPQDMRTVADGSGLFLPPGNLMTGAEARLPDLLRAIRAERKVAIAYADSAGARDGAGDLALLR